MINKDGNQKILQLWSGIVVFERDLNDNDITQEKDENQKTLQLWGRIVGPPPPYQRSQPLSAGK